MKNTFGTAFTVTLFGESHGPAVGAVLDGLAPGIAINPEFIAHEMDKRRAAGAISTARQEADEVEFLSGVYNGFTTGTPLCLTLRNANTHSKDYTRTGHLLRPGHADYTASQKYLGFEDPRGGGHFSGRLTAPIVAAGAICRQILAAHGITIGSHLAQCAGINDTPLPTTEPELTETLTQLNTRQFAVINKAAGQEMQQAILAAKQDQDSVGGLLETAITGLPAGLGEPFFGSVESVLSALFFSIPAVKGVEFGLGFGFAPLRGSDANDPFVLQNGQIKTQTNHNGGLNGGITNGMPVVLRAVLKPTPSIAKPQNTVNVATGTQQVLQLHGRHDPCVLHRARAVADAMAAIGLVDLFSQRYGTLWQTGGAPHCTV
ncbi:chorismate synthase [Ruminococcaceae bacterium OttesenSCG-928-A16]|nr:chorismate synthase [Ruminococcaceae bacterium OttesenSCG-928-A16]